MNYSISFGKLSAAPKGRKGVGSTFCLAVLGDFSGRANRGELETGAKLAGRKPRRVDVDNIDEVLESMELKLNLPIGDAGGSAEVAINSMDDFHPDELYDNVEVFAELATLRSRLSKPSSFAATAAEAQSWLAEAPADSQRLRDKPRGTTIPNAKLSDFAHLVGRSTSVEMEATPAEELIQQVVRPYIQPAADPAQDEMIGAVDSALSAAMRRLLHHPDFQTMESLWRGVDLLTRELETGTNLQIILYDISAEEVAADLSSTDNLEETGLYQLLVEKPESDTLAVPPSAIIGNYQFEQTPPHADLLGRISQIAAAAGAPFIASIGIDALVKKKPEEIPAAVSESWDALRSLPHTAYLGLTVPRFMLRWPYGAKTEPIDPFNFEEFTPQFGLKGMLWGNAAVIAGLMLGKTFQKQGMGGMQLGSTMIQGDLPVYYFVDQHNDQVALPCTERIVTEATAAHVISQGFMPLLWVKGRPEVRLGGFTAVSGAATLAGPWAPAEVSADSVPVSPAGLSVPVERESSGDSELDDILADLDAATEPEPAASDSSNGDAELDALLSDLDTAAEPDNEGEADGEEMDEDLAALLAEL